MTFRHAALAGLAGAWMATAAHAAPINTVQIFGDSFSDTGAGFVLTDGVTAASYLAELVGNPVVLPDAPNPGESSINFAESGARVDVEEPDGPTSLTNQVENYVDLVQSGRARLDPDTTLFFLSGGLNDHELAPAEEVAAAYTQQVAQLVDLGARYIQIALLPREVPPFTDSADYLNPAYRSLVPELAATYPERSITLSRWGEYYDDIILNPDNYPITNVTDPCFEFGVGQTCSNPEEYFYYYIVHPSDAAHRIVGAKLFEDVQELPTLSVAPVPLPAALPLMLMALGALAAAARTRRA